MGPTSNSDLHLNVGDVQKNTEMDNEKPALSILIPVYNEENTLEKILHKTSSLPIDNYEILIVDDASHDNSPKIIKSFLQSFSRKNVDIKHLTHAENRGKGAGIQTGLKYANGRYFVIQDADLEYDPFDIPAMLSEALEYERDAVYGSRFLGTVKGMSGANYIANRGYNIMLQVLYDTNITDMHTCYKMVKTSLIKELDITSNGFDYATELVSKLLKRGVKIHDVPISYNGRTKREGKKINIMDGIECAYKLFRFRFSKDDRVFSEKSTIFARFIIVGAVGFLSNYFILITLTRVVQLGYVLAEVIAAIIALHVTFFFHDTWTYQLRTDRKKTMLKLYSRYSAYLISNSFGTMMTIVTFTILYTHMNRVPALLFSVVAGAIWNYLMNTYFIWRRKNIG